MNLDEITPMILTFNEQSNLRKTLERLAWAKRILVIDSFSNDQTVQIASEFDNVELLQRKYDHFSAQCNFGLTNVSTSWVLSLDADYRCPESLPTELSELNPVCKGYRVNFQYCVLGVPLRSTLYPPRTVLYEKSSANYVRDGHAHRVEIDGAIGQLNSVILHDDHKPLSSWLAAQQVYARDEAIKLCSSPIDELGWKDRIRTRVFAAPVLTGIYCYFGKLLILDGAAGLYYSLQRVFAEVLLSLELLDHRLRK